MPDTVHISNRAHEISVPPEASALGTLSRTDYENAILVELDTVDASAQNWTGEQWARAMLEGAPTATRGKLIQQWTQFGLQLGPEQSNRHVLGWPVRRSTPGHILLGTTSDNGLHAELLIQRRPHTLLFVSFIQYDTDNARKLWAQAQHKHAPVMCQLIAEAVTRATPARLT